MILTCASCATRYYADDASIGEQGRTVRCAACGHTWFVAPQLVLDQEAGPAPAQFIDAPGETGLSREAVERARAAGKPQSAAALARAKQAERARQERMRAALIAWGGAGIAVAATVAASLAFRQDIARAWPNAASAYAAVGLPVNITGLEFVDINVERMLDGPTPMLIVSGAVRNVGSETRPAPLLRFSLRDERAEELHHWTARLEGGALAPGAARAFRTSTDSPPLGAVDLEATFTGLNAGAPAPAQPARTKPSPPSPHAGYDAAPGRLAAGGPMEGFMPLMPAPAEPAPIEGLAPRLPAEDAPQKD